MSTEVQFRLQVARGEVKPEWLKWAEASKLMGVSIPTLRRWRYRGVGPLPWRLGKNTLRYTKQEIVAYMERLAQGDPVHNTFKPRWDPVTFRLLEDPTEIPTRVSDVPAAAEPEPEPTAEVTAEEENQWRAAGVIGENSR